MTMLPMRISMIGTLACAMMLGAMSAAPATPATVTPHGMVSVIVLEQRPR